MDKILITYGTRPLSQRVAKRFGSCFSFLFATSEPFPDVLESKGYCKIPKSDESSYEHMLLDISLSNDVKYILPMDHSESERLSKVRVLYAEYGIEILIPEVKQDGQYVKICHQPDPNLDLRLIIKGKDVETNKTEHAIDLSGVFVSGHEGELYKVVI